MALMLKHQTVQEFIDRFREAYRDSDKELLVQLARWLLVRIVANDITDAQCRNSFNMGVVAWTTLKSKMQDWVNKYDSVQSARGE